MLLSSKSKAQCMLNVYLCHSVFIDRTRLLSIYVSFERILTTLCYISNENILNANETYRALDQFSQLVT